MTKFKDLEKLCLNEQYIDASYRLDMEKILTDANETRKDSGKDLKTIQEYQARCKVLTIENAQLKKLEALSGSVPQGKFRLFEPDFSNLRTELAPQDLKRAYMATLEVMYGYASKAVAKSKPNDIIFIFHSFNIGNMDKFVEREVPLRFQNNNIIIACCDPLPSSRRTIHDVASKIITPLKPRVILVDGALESGTPGNVLKFRGNNDVEKILMGHFEKWPRDFNQLQEGYANVLVIKQPKE